MIIVYQKVPESRIRREAKEGVPKIETWFVKNPKRKVCRTNLWYGKRVFIRRGHVAKDMEEAMTEALR
jgi:hypothetical protein